MLGVLADLHLKDNLSYSEYVKDGRLKEKQDILDFIANSLADCNKIVIAGDCFNTKNNTSATIKQFVDFLEKFDGKDVYIISGNHDRLANGTTAIDFLKQIKGKKWHIITDKLTIIDNITFLPYFFKCELGVETDEDGTKKLMEQLTNGNILVTHYAISDTMSKVSTNLFHEIVLPQEELKKKFNLIISGHIHQQTIEDRILVPGSIFNQEIGDTEKFIYNIDDNLNVQPIKLPGREIIQLKNPEEKDWINLPVDSIIKVILTEKMSKIKIADLKEKLKNKFNEQGAYIMVEQIANERERLHYGDGESVLEMTIPQLLEIYSKTKKVDLKKLLKGFELIN